MRFLAPSDGPNGYLMAQPSMPSSTPSLVSRFSVSRPLFDRLHFALAVVGLLVVVHLSIMVDRGFDRGCFGFSEPTATVECEIVTTSDAGSFIGVSNSTWGLVYYGILVLLGLLAGPLDPRRAALWRPARVAIVTFGLLYSGWLVYVQATEIGAFCKLCLMSAGITLLLFLLVVAEARSSSASSTSSSKMDSRFYGAIALAAVVLVVADLSYFSGLDVASAAPQAATATAPGASDDAAGLEPTASGTQAPQAFAGAPQPFAPTGECSWDVTIPAVADYQSLVQLGDPYLGSESAKVIVMEFIDPNCPHCRTMHPVMKRVVETHGTVAKVYVVPFMLWPEVSLLPIEALYVAAQDGKYYEMLEQQFAAQGPNGYTPAQLRQMAEDIGLDGATFQDRLARGLNRQAIVQRRMQISQLGVRGTPVVMINGRFVASESKTIACLRQMIDEAAAG